MEKNIFLTNHAKIKMEERAISLSMIKETIKNPDSIIQDKLDATISHFVKKFEGKHLRVLLRKENEINIIITTFFDRRIDRC